LREQVRGVKMQTRPYEGLKVIDFCWSGVGVFMLNFLGYYGATIVRVESSTYPDPVRAVPPFAPTYSVDEKPGLERSAVFSTTHVVKEYDLTLNMKNPKAIEVFKKLVAWADVIGEGFTTQEMEKRGLDYEDLKKIKPDIIMLRTNGYGHTGPMKNQPGFGMTIMANSGMCDLVGWPDRLPVPISSYYTDQLSPLLGGLALVAAIDYRRRTGKGMCIDHSQIEAGINYLTPLVLDYEVNGRLPSKTGNRRIDAAPHGAYRCKGGGRWVAIAVYTEEEWENFCRVVRQPDWTKDPRFATLEDRVRNGDELDTLLEKWTVNFTAEQVMSMMQAAGVASGVLSTGKDQAEDPQLKHYDFFHEMDHPYLGKRDFYHPPPFKLSRATAELAPPPVLGEDNEYVCTQILGMSDEDFVLLIQDEVFE
jgi:benzylsuccinate CoA-transferase BbsF subunit